MRALKILAVLLVAVIALGFADYAQAQCGRSVVTQQVTQPAQPQVSVFQLPQSQPITASQSATIGGQTFGALSAPAILPQSACATGACNLSVAPQATAATVVQSTSVRQRGGILQSLRASPQRAQLFRPQQVVRQRTVIRG